MSMQFRNRPEVRAVWRAAMAGHDAKAFVLPADIIDLANTHTFAGEELNKVAAITVALDEARRGLSTTIREALGARKPLPDGRTVVDAELQDRAHEALRLALIDSLTDIESELAGLLWDDSERIITTSLQPAHAETITDATKLTEALRGAPDDVDALLRGAEKQRKAWLEFEVVAERWRLIRDAVTAFERLVPARLDHDGTYSMMRNPRELWPNRQARPPWPTDSTALGLRWMIEHGAELWAPTVAQRDERFEQLQPAAEGRAAGVAGLRQ